MPSKKPKLDTFRKVANACGGILSDIAANLGVERSTIYNVRFDKMLQNSYLNGEYGATPIFETEEEINKLFSSLK